MVLLTALRRRREAGHRFAGRRLLCVAVLFGALLTLTPAVRSTMQYAIGRRMGRMLQGSPDGATKTRLVENWIVATSIAEKSWMLGSGLGNFDVALEEIRRELPHPELMPVGSQGWNLPAYVLATTGVVGLVFLLLPHLALAREAASADTTSHPRHVDVTPVSHPPNAVSGLGRACSIKVGAVGILFHSLLGCRPPWPLFGRLSPSLSCPRLATKTLREQNPSLRDIGQVLGVSYQRAHQLAPQ